MPLKQIVVPVRTTPQLEVRTYLEIAKLNEVEKELRAKNKRTNALEKQKEWKHN